MGQVTAGSKAWEARSLFNEGKTVIWRPDLGTGLKLKLDTNWSRELLPPHLKNGNWPIALQLRVPSLKEISLVEDVTQ